MIYSTDGDPEHGSVTVDPATGVWTYTPTPEARHTAAMTGTGGTFDVAAFTVSDGHGHTSSIEVTVVVDPANADPAQDGAPTVGPASTVTGTLTGAVHATDPDGDTLTYSGSTTTAQGTVDVQPATAPSAYTPTPEARAAAGPNTTDSFTVTVTDGHGGITPISVSVPVAQAATTPDYTTIEVGTYPVGVALSPDGTHAYVANFGSNTVSIIDTTTHTVTTIDVGSNPFGVAVSPDGSHAYVTNLYSEHGVSHRHHDPHASPPSPSGQLSGAVSQSAPTAATSTSPTLVQQHGVGHRHHHQHRHPTIRYSASNPIRSRGQPRRQPTPTSPTTSATRCRSSTPPPTPSQPPSPSAAIHTGCRSQPRRHPRLRHQLRQQHGVSDRHHHQHRHHASPSATTQPVSRSAPTAPTSMSLNFGSNSD